MPKSTDPFDRLSRLCLALPEAHLVIAWGEPTFRVKNKLFAMYASAENHHGAGRPAVWIKAEDGAQELLLAADPERYFRPPYVGPSGWVGVRLDRGVDWAEVAALLETAWRLTAPKRLVAAVGATPSAPRLPRPSDRRGGGRKGPRA